MDKMLLFVVSFLGMAPQDAPETETCTISGVVVNGTDSNVPIAGAEVQLRTGEPGMLTTIGATTTDAEGRFAFRDLPLDPSIVYLPGANRGGVHYPGKRVRFSAGNSAAKMQIVAFDAEREVSPLTAARHEIAVEIQEQVLEIRESILISNKSRRTYVGRSEGDQTPVTLQLSVPPRFDRVTFDNEFHGRRFRIVDNKLVTDIPWPPADMRLGFTYRLPIAECDGVFRRPLDLPSSRVTLQLGGKRPSRVTANLPTSTVSGSDRVAFATQGELPAGYVVELQFGRRPIPWLFYARWGSLAVLIALVCFTFLMYRQWNQPAMKHHGPPQQGRFVGRHRRARRRAA
jgi:hypothetical protein